MEKINSFAELTPNEKVIYCTGEKPRFMRFLMQHPRNEKYAYFTDMAEQAEMIYIDTVKRFFYKNYTDRDLIVLKRNRAMQLLKECDEALMELEKTGTTYKTL